MHAITITPLSDVTHDATDIELAHSLTFEEMYRTEYPGLVAVATALAGHDGPDLVHDAMVRALLKLEQGPAVRAARRLVPPRGRQPVSQPLEAPLHRATLALAPASRRAGHRRTLGRCRRLLGGGPATAGATAAGRHPLLRRGSLGSRSGAHPRRSRRVWVGQKLAGWYENRTFVPYTFGSELPAALLDASIEVAGLDSSTHRATVTDENCSEPYLSPSPSVFDVLFTTDAGVVGELAEPTDHPAELVAAVQQVGVSEAASRSYAVPEGGDGTSDRLVLVDGWNAEYQYPTWVATWDAETEALSALEGDLDPSQSLDIGNPVEAFYDLDRDGAWETVYGVGDGWRIQDLDTAESIVFGDAHPCPSQ